MANSSHLEILKKGSKVWNNWRRVQFYKQPDIWYGDYEVPGTFGEDLLIAELSCANLIGADLAGVNLDGANLTRADLSGTILTFANLNRASLVNARLSDAKLIKARLMQSNLNEAFLGGADLSSAKLSGSSLRGAYLNDADLSYADLSGADLRGAMLCKAKLIRTNLSGANLDNTSFNGADLRWADLSWANLTRAKFTQTTLNEANLNFATCIFTDFSEANFEGASIFRISINGLQTNNSQQENLIISESGTAVITVDNLEVAQLISLMLTHQKVRDLIGTIPKKGALILGRFTPERREILDAIRTKVREHDLVPITFDFGKVQTTDFTETIKILAGMSRFIIADISEPKNSPLELQATIPDYGIPFFTIIQKGEKPFSMFTNHTRYSSWILDTFEYVSDWELWEYLIHEIINKAIAKEDEIFYQKMHSEKPIENIRDLL